MLEMAIRATGRLERLGEDISIGALHVDSIEAMRDTRCRGKVKTDGTDLGGSERIVR